ncbi:hypothetical protein NP493_587g01013 [Ridgeia piscesae]|uniref:AGC-kinase C-terminal domain-containing protein n=1 Tax=Ridgeia piscesae TaxID=27915 RepID=A0AAD9KUP0_RIDPI|nr:hypothetical protein NP493_587g01013 [Ridgeia piscesae]
MNRFIVNITSVCRRKCVVVVCVSLIRLFASTCRDLVKKLLVQDRTKRLGNMKNGAEDIKRHKWFKPLNWEAVYNKKLQPPIVPRIRHRGDPRNFFPDTTWGEPPIIPVIDHPGDTHNFDDYNDDDWRSAAPVSVKEAELFADF